MTGKFALVFGRPGVQTLSTHRTVSFETNKCVGNVLKEKAVFAL